MPKRSSKKKVPKRNLNQLAFSIVQQATTEPDSSDSQSTVKSPLDDPEIRRQVMREMGSRGGLKGGRARAESLSAEDRSRIARKAANARWKKEESNEQ